MPEPSIQERFQQIASLPAPERESALDRLSITHPEQAAEIRRLLPYHVPEAAESSLSSPPSLSDEVDLFTMSSESGSPDAPAITGFQVTETIDQGGQSTVYLATQINPRRRVAIKVLRSSILDPRAQDRFLTEAELQGSIRHPAIVGIHACGLKDANGRPLPWIAMELVPGARNIVEAAGSEGWDRRRRLDALATVAEAIHAAHLRGVIHRDLKPGNILVDVDGRVRIIDFGIARLVDAADNAAMTREGEVLGTIRYLAPEQLRGAIIDARADVHALGVLAFELLHGRSPYGEVRSTPALIAAVERHEIEHPRARTRSERDLNAVLGRSLAADPAERYESMAAFARDLRSLADANRVDARPPGALDEARRLARRHPLPFTLTTVLLMVVMIGLAGSAWLLQRAREAHARRTLWLASAAIRQGDFGLAEHRLAAVEAAADAWSFDRDDLSFPTGLLRCELDQQSLERPIWLQTYGNRYDIGITRGPARDLAVAAGGGWVTIIDLSRAEPPRNLALRRSPATSIRGEVVVVSVDPRASGQLTFATLDTHGDIMVFDLDRARLPGGGEALIPSLIIDAESFGPENLLAGKRGIHLFGDHLAIGHPNGRVDIHPIIRDDSATDRRIRLAEPTSIETGLDGSITAVAVDAESDRWLVGTAAGDVGTFVLERASGTVARRHGLIEPATLIARMDGLVRRVAISPDTLQFAACGGREVISGPIPTPGVAPSVPFRFEDSGIVWNLAFSDDGRRLAVTGRSGVIRLLSTADGTPTLELDELSGVTWSSAWHGDDLYITTERGLESATPTPEGIVVLRGSTRAEFESTTTRRYGGGGDDDAELRVSLDRWTLHSHDRRIQLDFSSVDAPPGLDDVQCVSARSVPDTPGSETLIGAIVTRRDGILGILDNGVVQRLATADECSILGERTREIRIAPDGSFMLWRNEISGLWWRAGDATATIGRGEIPSSRGDSSGPSRTRAMAIFDPPSGSRSSLTVGTQDGRLIDLHFTNGQLQRGASWEPIIRTNEAGDTHPGWVLAFAASPNGDVLFIGNQNGEVTKWVNGRRVSGWGIGRRRSMIRDIALHQNGEHVVVLDSRGFLDVLNVDSGEPLVTLGPISGTPIGIAIRGDTVTAYASRGRSRSWGNARGDARPPESASEDGEVLAP